MYFFILKVKISLQMVKFPGNDLAKMPTFSHQAYYTTVYMFYNILKQFIQVLK